MSLIKLTWVLLFPGPTLPLAPLAPQFVFDGPGHKFSFHGPGPQFVYFGPGPQFVFACSTFYSYKVLVRLSAYLNSGSTYMR